MTNLWLRPDLKTSGGEICDLVQNGKFVGSLSLVYRENDRMAGSLQLDSQALTGRKGEQEVIQYVQDYVQSLIDAMNIAECDVLVTSSAIDQAITTGELDEQDVLDDDFEYVEDEPVFGDFDPDDADRFELQELQGLRNPDYYNLIIVGESRNRVEYHIYDRDDEWIAEAFITIRGRDITGEVNWQFEPLENEVEKVAELIVSDYDDAEIDTFELHMKYDGELIESIDLMHEDLLDMDHDGSYGYEFVEDDDDEDDDDDIYEDDDEDDEWYEFFENDDIVNDYSVILIRDDGDTLTYDVHKQSHGGLPIGTATIDISRSEISGFIDFRDPGDEDDREIIASLLMQQLDKEKDYRTFNISMLYHNKLIDEMLFEIEQIH